DVTARKEAERDRESLLTQAQEQNERLRKLDRMKDEFIALVSHELRTPLTSICGYLELLLQDDVMAELPADRHNWLEVIDRNAERLLRLVEDLLLTAQASAGSLALDKSDLDVAAVVARARRAGRGGGGGRRPCRSGARVLAQLDARAAPARERRPPAHRPGHRQPRVECAQVHAAGGSVEVRTYRHNGAVRIEVADTGMG